METETAPSRLARVAYWTTFGVLCSASLELARYDHGVGRTWFWVAYVVAPVVLIFGASAAGVRRWWGWPDFGPVPGRVALLAAAVVAGSLAGHRVRADDVAVTQARGERLRRDVREWRDRTGRWPDRLEEAVGAPPRTRMGVVAPPPFGYDAARRRLSFPLGGDGRLALDLEDPSAGWTRG